MRYLADCMKNDRLLTFFVLEDQALRNRPNQLFLIFENRTWTYSEFYRSLLRVGNWLMKDLGIKRGEIVALDGGNSPEYLMLWYALEGIGGIPSFVNNNLTGNSLVHCIKVLAPTRVKPWRGD
jgi:acyl-CoA synthetase (AMP-forming)/AMP-acid ligase II